MTLLDHFSEQFAFNAWANEQIAQALEATGLYEGEPAKLFAHVLGAEVVWYARLRREELPHGPHPEWTLAECAPVMMGQAERWRTLLRELDDDALQTAVPYTTLLDGSRHQSPVRHILQHVVIHGHYHRGQLARTIRQAGGQPPSMDYMVFARTVGGDKADLPM